MRPLIDAHLDLAMNVIYYDRDIRQTVDEINAAESGLSDLKFRGNATLSLPELRESGVPVCFATLLSRSGPRHRRQPAYGRGDLDFPVREAAWACNQAQLALYRLLEQQGELRIIRTVEDLDEHWTGWQAAGDRAKFPIGIVITMEGADGILEPAQVHDYFRDGVRAVGPAHYGHSHYAAGTGVEGGLTENGRRLLDEMAQCGMVLEVTHLADQAMAEAFSHWGNRPLWASHHNCRSLVPWQRQLTDAEITVISQCGGVIGTACDAVMLDWPFAEQVLERRRAGRDRDPALPPLTPTVTLQSVVDQMVWVRSLTGSTDGIGIGTDLDGGYGNEQTPSDLRRYRDLHHLETLLERADFSSDQIDAIFHGNWLRVLRQWLPRRPAEAPHGDTPF